MKSLTNYYHRFDKIPQYNFQNFLDENNPEYLLKNKDAKLDPELALQAWDNIFQEYIDFMGVGNRQRMIMSKENRICKLSVQIYVEGKVHLKAILLDEQNSLNLLKQNLESKVDASSETARISKYLGFHLPIKEISAKEYYSYVKEIKSDG